VVWDAGDVYRHHDPLKMLEAFERHLERLAACEENTSELNEIIEIVVRENRLAILWQRLLRLGARFPRTLGSAPPPLGLGKAYPERY
jgi:hypothetical protein